LGEKNSRERKIGKKARVDILSKDLTVKVDAILKYEKMISRQDKIEAKVDLPR
jgi:hypothetical protein